MSNIVAVTFDSADGYTGRSPQSRRYHYKSDLDLKVGDQCVVDSPYGTKLVTVQEINPPNGARNATKWIVSKVDRARFQARQEAERLVDELKGELSTAVRQAEEQEKFRQLAARYPEVASVVSRLEAAEAVLQRLNQPVQYASGGYVHITVGDPRVRPDHMRV